MSWIEAPSGVVFVDWGKEKEREIKADVIVVKEKESVEGIIDKIDEEFTDGEVSGGKIYLTVKKVDKPVMLYINSAILRQHKELKLQPSEKVRFTFTGQYPTKSGKKGNGVKVAVDR